MFNMFGGKPVHKPSPVVVVAPTRQRNEKEVLLVTRTSGRVGRTVQRKPNFNLLEANEIIVVDPVRGEHGGFIYVAGDSADKQTRHHESKANRFA